MNTISSEVLIVGKYVRRRIKIKGALAEVSTQVWGLECPLCTKLGKTGVVPTPATHVWQANLGDLQKAIKEGAEHYTELLEDHNGHQRSKLLCNEHGLMLRTAGIRTYRFHETLVRSAERRLAEKQRSAANSVAAILGGEKVEAIEKIGHKVDRRKVKQATTVTPTSGVSVAEVALDAIPSFQGPEVGVSTPSRRGSLKAPRAKKVGVKEGKGHKPLPPKRKQGKNLARGHQDEIES